MAQVLTRLEHTTSMMRLLPSLTYTTIQRRRNQGGFNAVSLGAQPEPDGPGSDAEDPRGRSHAVSRTRSTSRLNSQVRGLSQTRQIQ